jgi:hypothetical protein
MDSFRRQGKAQNTWAREEGLVKLEAKDSDTTLEKFLPSVNHVSALMVSRDDPNRILSDMMR